MAGESNSTYVLNYSGAQVDEKLSKALIYKGTLGTGGTITSLPASHELGETYKIITAGTYAGVACSVGDLILCIVSGSAANNAHWLVLPSGAISNFLPLSGGTMEGRLNIHGTPINGAFSGTGTAAYDADSGTTRYHPAIWTFNTGFTATDGDIFILKVPVAGHTYGVYISIDNGTNYYPAIIQGTTRLQTSFGVDTYAAFIFESTASAASMYPVNGGADRVTVEGGAFRVLNYYDSNTNTLQRTYRSTTNVELPIAGISTASSATAAYSAISSGSYKDVYAAIPNDTTKIATINPSTGAITVKNLTASRSISTDANKKLVSTDLSVSSATAETTEATTFVHSVTQGSTGKITVKTRPMPSYILSSAKGAASGVAELDSNGKVPSSQLPASDVLNITATPGENNTFTTTTAYTDFTAALSAGKVIQVSIPTISASGILAGKTGNYYTFNMYDSDAPTVYIYVFTVSNVENMLQFTLADAQKTIDSSWQMSIPNAGKYILSSTGTETAWVKHELVMVGTPAGSLTNDYITTTTSWSDYYSAVYNHHKLILEIPSASLSLELQPQETNGSLVNCIAHVALDDDTYVAPFTFSASNNNGNVQFRYNNQILVYTDYAATAHYAHAVDWGDIENNPIYNIPTQPSSDGSYTLNRSTSGFTTTFNWTPALELDLPNLPGSTGDYYLSDDGSGNGSWNNLSGASVSYADSAGSANSADTAMNADYATSAGSADTADSFAASDQLSDGSYILDVTSGSATWAGLPSIPDVPDAPSSNGSYILGVSSGTASWSSLPSIPAAPYVGTFNLTTTWSGNGPYTQTVSISGGTANSKIDLQPNSTVLTQMTTDGVTAMYVENNNGTFTVYALGAAPSAALTIQYTRTEVTTS